MKKENKIIGMPIAFEKERKEFEISNSSKIYIKYYMGTIESGLTFLRLLINTRLDGEAIPLAINLKSMITDFRFLIKDLIGEDKFNLVKKKFMDWDRQLDKLIDDLSNIVNNKEQFDEIFKTLNNINMQ